MGSGPALSLKSSFYRIFVTLSTSRGQHTDDDVMAPDYHCAVHFCLSPRPSDNMSYSFEDEGFRELYYTEVIRSLEEDAKCKLEIKDSDWREEIDGLRAEVVLRWTVPSSPINFERRA
ncbi:hypothetical protein LTR84_000867 [Exophiala bonariae]|uniref:Uncharacterized protein n=1 Tax=Exophiala bonariae TaxID=1690606 RepID=A0AAV9NV93_9EURO|nr:hypothetical protein LTR84_000867 [Exophiala bonariae]